MEEQRYVWIVFTKDTDGDYEQIANVFDSEAAAAEWKKDAEKLNRWMQHYTRKYLVFTRPVRIEP